MGEQLLSFQHFVLLGEAGCGKSELAVNLAGALRQQGRAVHLFDLDMTKPLYRTRELGGVLAEMGVTLHFETQVADAPTQVGGLRPCLLSRESSTILDVGGDANGARAIGGYAPLLNRDNTAVLYVINPYRPWSGTAESAAETLSRILAVSHLRPDKVLYAANPFLGAETTPDDVTAGLAAVEQMVERVTLLCVPEALAQAVTVKVPVLPMRRHIRYPWNER